MVFPGATLTIEQGTVIEFTPGVDSHKFSAGVENLAEIFVYGTLNASGESAAAPIRFRGKDVASTEEAWGGLHKMAGGSINLEHTEILNASPLLASFGSAAYEVAVDFGARPSTPTLEEDPVREILVEVRLTPPPVLQAVSIPITVSSEDAEAGDYMVEGLTDGGMVFGVGEGSNHLAVRANQDTDVDPETVQLEFGSLPGGVIAGEPATATVTIHDVGRVPPKPTEGLSVTRGLQQLTVQWDAVSGYPRVTGYTLQYQKQVFSGTSTGTSEWSTWYHLVTLDSEDAEVFSYPHDGVNWPTRYRYQVRASNVRGDGDWSDPFPPNGVSPRPPRPVPVWLEPLDDLTGRITVDCPYPNPLVCSPLPEDCPNPATCLPFTTQIGWKTGDDNNAMTQWYTESFGVVGGVPGLSGAGGLTVTAHTVGSLDPAMTHQFRVRIVADGQEGEASDPTWLVPLDAQAGANAGEVDLSWRTPTDASLTGLVYQYRSGTEALGPWQEIDGSGPSTTQYTVDGLNPGVSYQFQVRAVEGTGTQTGGAMGRRSPRTAGTSRAGAGRTRVTSFTKSAMPVGKPDAPENLRAAPGDGQVSLTWETPSNNGSPLTGYQYRQSSDGAGTWLPDWGDISDSDSTTASHTLMSLSNGTEYTFEVRAVNAVGSGHSSKAQATPGRGPPPVRNPEASGANGQVELSWDGAVCRMGARR